MIFQSTCEQIYDYIMQVELMFILRYNMNPFELLGNLSLLDFDSYMNRMFKQLEDREKKDSPDSLMMQLRALRDQLNVMNIG